MNARMKTALTVDLLRKIAFDELSIADGVQFYGELRSGNTSVDPEYAGKSLNIWKEKKILTLPQPMLKKNLHKFGINEVTGNVKCLNARFDKRILMIPHLCQDLAIADRSNPDSLYPSLPFGYKCELLGNITR